MQPMMMPLRHLHRSPFHRFPFHRFPFHRGGHANHRGCHDHTHRIDASAANVGKPECPSESRRIGPTVDPYIDQLFPSRQDSSAFFEMLSDPTVIDITVDIGRPVTLHFQNDGHTSSPQLPMNSNVVTAQDVQAIWNRVAGTSDNLLLDRCVIENTLHRVSCLRHFDGTISGLTIRLAHTTPDVHSLTDDFKTYLALGYSTLIFGPPGSGKTTLLRTIAAYLADYVHRRVVVVDEIGELQSVGTARRMCVHDSMTHADTILSVIRNHTPGAVVVDELMTHEDVTSAMTASQRGIQLIATAHADTLENVMGNPVFRDMLGGVQHAALSDAEMSQRGSKFVMARKTEPVFRGAFDVQRQQLYTHLGRSVDQVMSSRPSV